MRCLASLELCVFRLVFRALLFSLVSVGYARYVVWLLIRLQLLLRIALVGIGMCVRRDGMCGAHFVLCVASNVTRGLA